MKKVCFLLKDLHAETTSAFRSSFARPTTTSSSTATSLSHLTHHHTDADSLSAFQHGFYRLFKGHFELDASKDPFIHQLAHLQERHPESSSSSNSPIISQVLLPAVHMSLRLHQDHFQSDATDDNALLLANVRKFERECVIGHERAPEWRRAVLTGATSLLALRHQLTEYSDQYKVVMLNRSFLSFRLIKLNRESVRAFWAAQQHELVFVRNKNQERGSIQNAKQVLRNVVNSSCDPPVGYPIFVSAMTTSYSSTHEQLSKMFAWAGQGVSVARIVRCLRHAFERLL